MGDQHSRFPRECRRFLANLVDHVDQLEVHSGGGEPVGQAHAERCRSCAARLEAARRQTVLLSTLPRLKAPMDLAIGIADVYERAIRRGEHEIGGALHEALTPVHAPQDVVWQDAPEPPNLMPSLRSLWPARSAPGWMWSRIRAEIHGPKRPEDERPRRWFDAAKLGLLAAALLVSLVVLVRVLDGPIQGTPSIESIVWHVTSEPLDSSLSLHTLVQISRR